MGKVRNSFSASFSSVFTWFFFSHLFTSSMVVYYYIFYAFVIAAPHFVIFAIYEPWWITGNWGEINIVNDRKVHISYATLQIKCAINKISGKKAKIATTTKKRIEDFLNHLFSYFKHINMYKRSFASFFSHKRILIYDYEMIFIHGTDSKFDHGNPMK